MSSDKPKFRLRLNLFDALVLVLALAAAAFLAWRFLTPDTAPLGDSAQGGTVRYTLRIGPWVEGTGELVEEGDLLIDNVRNYELGNVTGCRTEPSVELILDETNHRYILADLAGYEDAYLTVESPCSATEENITVGGGYVIQVGKTVYVRGEGYLGTAVITEIEREGLE